jgi:hypothetical protein
MLTKPKPQRPPENNRLKVAAVTALYAKGCRCGHAKVTTRPGPRVTITASCGNCGRTLNVPTEELMAWR